MADRVGIDEIGKNKIGRKSFGMQPVGRVERTEAQRNKIVRTKFEKNRDKSRRKFFEMRKGLKEKVEKNEWKMEKRKSNKEKKLNPLVFQTMPSWKYAKSLRNPVNWSSVPKQPKYSGALTERERIYGKRFDWIEGKKYGAKARKREE